MKPIIKVESLSKQYRLGQVGTASIKDDWKRFWYRIRGKEDPFATLGEANDRSTRGSSDYVWALRDIDFEVRPGEVLGIIGRNGAGKSTLLKILSRVTEPTTGRVTMHGRVASLLEVGTGMHPDLTGRENVYLNGAILGMTKKEISRKFDEILDFAGVERYIDTPVKRYSSGMHVRLGFAVAAHLEPEILIVDEVLAVGDAEFQKKCLGKMKDASQKEGRTVLFVSHNLPFIDQLCTRAILLEFGTTKFDGIVKSALSMVKSQMENVRINTKANFLIRDNPEYGSRVKITQIEILNSNNSVNWRSPIFVSFELTILENSISELYFGLGLNDEFGVRVCTFESEEKIIINGQTTIKKDLIITGPHLYPGEYSIAIGIRSGVNTLDFIDQACTFEILNVDEHGNFKLYGNRSGSGKIEMAVISK